MAIADRKGSDPAIERDARPDDCLMRVGETMDDHRLPGAARAGLVVVMAAVAHGLHGELDCLRRCT